jgi:hypothetical protein
VPNTRKINLERVSKTDDRKCTCLDGSVAVSHNIVYRGASQESTNWPQVTDTDTFASSGPLVLGRSDMSDFMWLEIRCA